MSEPFDPDEYLKAEQEFDPDAYLAETPLQAAAPPTPEASPFEGAVAVSEGKRGIPMGTARGAVAAALQGPALSWADEAAGRLAQRDQAIRNFVAGKTEVDPDWAYRNARDKFRAVESDFREENPKTAFGLTVGSGAVLGGPVQGAGKGLTRLLPGMFEGAVAGAGAADEAEDMGFGAAVGIPLGAAGQLAGEIVGEGARAVGRLATGVLQPTPAARYLQGKGVNDLTVGQMAPDSFLAQMEEAGTSIGGIGPSLRAQREAGQAAFQQAVLREALPPGSPGIPAGGGLGEQLAGVLGQFDDAYAAAHGHPIAPESIRTVLTAVDDPSVYASDAARTKVGKWIRNALTALRTRQDGDVDSDAVIRLRSGLRERVRNLTGMDAQTQEERALFQAAADSLTDTLDAQLPPSAANMLRATDAQYAKVKTVADAIGRAKDQTAGFTTMQLTNAVKEATPESTYQRGGGLLRDMARAGEETIGAKVSPTGQRLLAAGPVPYVTGPMSYIANLPGPKAFLTGQTGAQQALRTGIERSGLGRYANLAQQAGIASTVPTLQDIARDRAPQSDAELVTSLAQSNPEALGPYAQTLQQAQAEGRLSVVHYVLQQRDPEYRQMLEQAREAQR